MRRIRLLLLALLALVLLLCMALGVLVSTQAGSRWFLNQVPGLSVQDFQGHLSGNWQATELIWQSGGQRVELQAPQMNWSVMCLWRGVLCIEALQAKTITIELPPSQTSDQAEGAFRLPELDLPIAVELEQVQVGQLRIQGQDLLDIELQLKMRGRELVLDKLQLGYDQYRLQASGSVQTYGDWTTEIKAHLSLPAPDEKPWTVELEASGELQRALVLKAHSQGYLQATLEGQLEALGEGLPLQLKLNSEAFVASQSLPASLALEDLKLTAVGDLTQGYQVLGQARLPGTQGPVQLTLDAALDTAGLLLRQLQLDAGEARQVSLQGAVGWQQALQAKGQLALQNFPWQSLYPVEAALQIQQFNANVDYADEAFSGAFDGQFSGPAGAFNVASSLTGSLESVHLPDLQLKAEKGHILGEVTLGLAPDVSWHAGLQVQNIDPALWVAELPGLLNGQIQTQGLLHDEQPQWQVQLKLDGQLRNQTTRLEAQGSGGGVQMSLPHLDLQLGDNRVQGQLEANQVLSGQLKLALNRLNQLWPGLGGQLQGQLALAGKLTAPQANLELQGQGISFVEHRLSELALSAQLNAKQQATLGLTLDGVRSGETALGQIQIKGSGSLEAHQAQLSVQGPLLNSQITADGAWNKDHWRGRLATARIQIEQQDWQLRQAASVDYLANGQLNLGAHCWASVAPENDRATLCAGVQRLLPNAKLDYRLEQFALASLQPWLPDDLQWQATLEGLLQVELPASGPRGQVRFNAGPGVLKVREGQQWLDFAYQRLELNSQLGAQRIQTHVDFSSARLGQLQLALNLDPRGAKALEGNFELKGVDLSVVRPFIEPVEHLTGMLNGSGRISGNLLAPRVDGALRLSDGWVSGPELPLQIEQLQMAINIAGEQARLEGHWRSGAQGQGQINGTLSWQPQLQAQIDLTARNLPITVQPYAELNASPELRISLAGERLAIAGRIEIPSGAIEVRELPPSTVRLSSDAVLVGEEDSARSGLDMAMDVDVVVGQDKLTFKGFGLSAELVGQVHIGDNLETRGTLSLKKGRYRAYGQRLEIRRARVFFAGPVDQPYLDVEAIRKVDNVVAGLRLSGNLQQPTTTIFSEPAMGQEQALSYLVLGRPISTQSSEDNNMLAQAALALGLAGSASLTSDIASALGIREFEIDTQGSGLTTSVVASGRITERLSLRYGVGVFEPASTFALRYELTRRLYLEAASGLASSLDMFYRRDY